MIDTHCHLDDLKYDGEREKVISSFLSEGIELVINNASSPVTTRSTFELARDNEKIYAALGCHPNEALDYTREYERELMLLCEHKKVVAVGEIGLDYHYDQPEREVQKQVFARQLCVADELGLPVVLHIRDAYEDAFEILKANASKLRHGGELHCYSGSAEMAKRFSNFDLYFAFGGAITYKNAKKEPVIKAVQTERLLVETDCPYLAPVPMRGKTNYPAYVRFTLEKMADVLETSFQEAEQITSANAKRLFGI